MNKTKIEWAYSTWNPVTGCSKVSPGCENCYAERQAKRLEKIGARKYRNGFHVTQHEKALEEPLQKKYGERIFVGSMGDLFHEKVTDDFLNKIFGVMAMSSHHDFLLLTKRPERALEYLKNIDYESMYDFMIDNGYMTEEEKWDYAPGGINCKISPDPVWPFKNVWVGVSVENQEQAEKRIPELLKIDAAYRFLSCEPLLEEIDLGFYAQFNHPYNEGQGVQVLHGIDWVICGGESGQKARPMHPDWVRSLRDQCDEAAVSFFFKQWGEWAPLPAIDPRYKASPIMEMEDGVRMCRVGKKAAGNLLDGKQYLQYPNFK